MRSCATVEVVTVNHRDAAASVLNLAPCRGDERAWGVSPTTELPAHPVRRLRGVRSVVRAVSLESGHGYGRWHALPVTRDSLQHACNCMDPSQDARDRQKKEGAARPPPVVQGRESGLDPASSEDQDDDDDYENPSQRNHDPDPARGSGRLGEVDNGLRVLRRRNCLGHSPEGSGGRFAENVGAFHRSDLPHVGSFIVE